MKSAARKIVQTTLVALTLGTMIAAPGIAMAEDKPEADFTIAAYSQYIWRGYELSQDSVVLQPSMTVSYKGFAVNLWGNLDTDYYGTETTNWNETDATISYDGSAGKIGYGIGLIYYDLEDGAEDSVEIYGSVGVDTILAPTVTFYNDIENYPGYYVTLGISHSLPISKDLGVDLVAQVGYLDNEANYSEFHDGILSASMSIPVGDYVSITPELNYVFALTNDSETAIKAASVDGDDDSFLFGGISASISF